MILLNYEGKMKKIISILCIFLLTTLPLSAISISNEHTHHVPDDEIIKENDCGCESNKELTQAISLEDVFFLHDAIIQSPTPKINNNLPSFFSWRDINGTNWVPPAKDQGSCGSCWDFAAMGALESIIQIREDCAGLNLDLSEQYVLSCLHAAGSCNGGLAYNAYRYIKANTSQGNFCNGIIPEQCFPYEVSDDILCANASPNWQEFLIPISTYGRWIPKAGVEGRNAIKTQIMESGPVVATMLFTIYLHGPDNLQEWGYTHDDPTDYYPYHGPIQGTNHQVIIIGWKDDPSIGNGGYWIVKNSLSEEWGYDGFFNIEYGSLNIDTVNIDWVEYHAENNSNWMPVAHIIGPTQGQSNQAMNYDGSESFDHEGSIVSYEWDFGDGTTGTGETITHTYTHQGIYRVTLTVTDNASNTNEQSIWVCIDTENHPPKTPRLIGRWIGENGTAYRYTFWSTDPDGDEVEFYLNWGDDYWFGGAAGWLGPFKSGEIVTLEKTWLKKGNYTVRVKAKDTYGAKSDWTTLEVRMPVSYTPSIQWFLDQLLQRFLSAFPIFRYLLSM
ncbi:hypothetical protein AYK25_08740 [Thermoplasmatales archaeon SM1-50]|nr:MAG: hypothetical protein AYK25_08740 [Thermoplasmatales archaeon SM1-50]